MVKKYGIKYFYDITDRADFRANPDYKGVCHIAMAQEGHCLPGMLLHFMLLFWIAPSPAWHMFQLLILLLVLMLRLRLHVCPMLVCYCDLLSTHM